jgi:hypothetical protein
MTLSQSPLVAVYRHSNGSWGSRLAPPASLPACGPHDVMLVTGVGVPLTAAASSTASLVSDLLADRLTLNSDEPAEDAFVDRPIGHMAHGTLYTLNNPLGDFSQMQATIPRADPNLVTVAVWVDQGYDPRRTSHALRALACRIDQQWANSLRSAA